MAPVSSVLGDIPALAKSFERYLRAANRSPRTVETYLEAVEQLARFLAERGMPTDAARVRREHVEAYLEMLLERWKPATASNRFRALQQFFKYLVDEGEVAESPMRGMTPPQVPEQPVPVLSEDDLRRLLADGEGKEFEDRRDAAIIRLLADTGMRRGELLGLRVDDFDLDQQVAFVVGKGRRERACPFGRKTALAVDRYLRVGRRHPHAELPWCWIQRRGRLNESGLATMLRRRGERAGIPDLHPHQLRHTFAHAWLASGGNEGDLMRLAGWRGRDMPVPPTNGPGTPTVACRWAIAAQAGQYPWGVDRSSAEVKPGWENRPVRIPDDVDDASVTKASGRVRLPVHIYWSGDDPQNKQWDLDDPLQRELVYRMVMIEGDEDDVRYFIDVDQLIAMWPGLFLPLRVKEAWSAWLRDHRGVLL